MKNHLINYQYINTDTQMQKFRHYLSSESIESLAIDFEGEFSLHQYGETLCLIQIFDGKNFYAIDPFHISKEELEAFFETRHIVKIFFAAQSDRMLLYKQYGLEIQSLCDLADMVQILEGQAKGLDSVLQNYLGVEVLQKKKFQKHNWTLRPIQEQAMQYALQDVEYLFPLFDKMLQQLNQRNLMKAYILKLVSKDNRVKINPIPGVKRKREYKKLSKEQKRIFDSLYDVREAYAQKMNWPPNNVISNNDLHKIARGSSILEESINRKVPSKIKEQILKTSFTTKK